MTVEFQEDKPSYTVGRPDMEGDKRRYWKNRPLAMNFANQGQEWYDNVYSATAELVPSYGFVAVLHCYHNVPDAWEQGFEVRVPKTEPEQTPKDWAAPKKPERTRQPGEPTSAPRSGATARVWAIADELATSRDDRGKVIQACLDAGINKSTAATQWSKWAKAKGL